MNERMRGYVVYGAEIISGGTGKTRVVCERLGKDGFYIISEVDEAGSVVRRGEALQRIILKDLGSHDGVMIETHDKKLNLDPDKVADVQLGSHSLMVFSKYGNQVRMDGKKPTELTASILLQRYK